MPMDTRANGPINLLIVDDHRLMLDGTATLLKNHFPLGIIQTAQSVLEARDLIQQRPPDLLLIDLCLPERWGDEATITAGLEFLQDLMGQYPDLNLTVQSSNLKALIRILPDLESHHGGLTLVDKSSSPEELLRKVDWAINGITHTKEIQGNLEFRSEWLHVLHLAFEQGLQDKAIAREMNRSERTIRHYWSKIQDALSIYPESEHNMRALTQIRAREVGLID
ncbi:MAG: hypothetical protein Fur0042_17690 [Cyanophyceae cyanobacterium]